MIKKIDVICSIYLLITLALSILVGIKIQNLYISICIGWVGGAIGAFIMIIRYFKDLEKSIKEEN